MRGVNKVILVGTLGRDPETKTFPNGGSITTFSIATSESWKDKNTGERQESTEWHRISTNNRLAEISAQYLKKGSKVYIEGSLRTRKWTDKDGVERYTTEIRAESLQMLDGAPKQGNGDNSYPEYPQGGGNQNGYGGNQGGYQNNQNGNQGGQNGNQGGNYGGQQQPNSTQSNQPAAHQQAPQNRPPQNQQPAGNYNQNPASGANSLDDDLPF